MHNLQHACTGTGERARLVYLLLQRLGHLGVRMANNGRAPAAHIVDVLHHTPHNSFVHASVDGVTAVHRTQPCMQNLIAELAKRAQPCMQNLIAELAKQGYPNRRAARPVTPLDRPPGSPCADFATR